MRHAFAIALALSVASPSLAQSTAPASVESLLRLLCQGNRESKLLVANDGKIEAVTFQVDIRLPSGYFVIDGLALYAGTAGGGTSPPHRFEVSEDGFQYQTERKAGETSLVSKLTINRYSGIAREFQIMMPIDVQKHYTVSGTYQCTRLTKPVF
jgi:hypothetical protein